MCYYIIKEMDGIQKILGGNMAKTERLYIRIDEDLKKKLQELAEKEHRTLSNYVESILIREIEKDKK